MPDTTLKITSYNIQFGRGLDGVIDLDRTCDPLRSMDIICLQEVDQFWQRSGDIDQVAAISERLPGFHHVFGSSFDMDADTRLASGLIVNRRRRHGDMVLSRWPILSMRTFNLPKHPYPAHFNMQMGFVECVIDCDGLPLRLYNYHAGYLATSERLDQVNLLADVIRDSAREGPAWCGKPDIDGDPWDNGRAGPPMPINVVLCGDFNAPPESDEYRLLLERTGLSDCWSLHDKENFNTPTLRKETSEEIQVAGRVDQIFVSAALVSRVTAAWIDEAADGSDHKPVMVTLRGA